MVFGRKILPLKGDGGGSDSPRSSSGSDHILASALSPSNNNSRLKNEFGSGLGLGKPGQSGGDALERVRSVAQMRRMSVADMHRRGASGTLGTMNGSLASYFSAPHPKPGKGVVFSPRGDLLLRFGFGPEIKVMKTVNGSHAATLRATAGGIRFADWSPDGALIVAASDDMHIFVYDVEKALMGVEGMLKADIDVGDEPVAYCLVCPGGNTVLSCDDDGQLETWSIRDRKMIQRYTTGHSSVMASFSGDASHIVSCADFECGLVLLNAATAEAVASESFDQLIEGRNKTGYAIAPNGKYVAAYVLEQTWGPNLSVYNVEARTSLSQKVCGGAVLDVQFSADGAEFIVSGRDNMIHVYDTVSMELVTSLTGHACDVLFCRVSGDRAYAISGDSDGDVFVWDVTNGDPMLRLQAHSAPVVSCDMSVDGRRAFTLDAEGNAYLWYLDMHGLFDVLLQNSHQLTCAAVAPDGRRVVVGYDDGSLRLWALGMYISQAWVHVKHGGPVECLAINPTRGVVASGDRNGVLLLTLLSSGHVLSSIQAHNDVIGSLCYSGNGARLLSAGRNGTLCLWNDSARTAPGTADNAIPEGDEGDNVDDHDDDDEGSGGEGIAAVRGGMTATTSTAPSIGPSARASPVELTEGSPLRVFEDPADTLPGVSMCLLDARATVAAAACLGGHVALWDTRTGTLTAALPMSDVEVTALCFSDSGRYLLAGAADGSVAVVDAAHACILTMLAGNASAVTHVYFQGASGPGRDLADLTVVSVCSRQALVWSLADPRRAPVSCADFISGANKFFRNSTLQDRVFVAHNGLALYDPLIRAAVYDMRGYENPPGNSGLFRLGTSILTAGVHHKQLVMYSPPDSTVNMLVNESGGVRCLDFSPNGKLLVSGNLRGELSVWDMVHNQLIKTWMAHKRSAITCVKFSHDSTQVYSCGEDTKVVLWHWTTCNEAGLLQGHQSAVVSVDMSLNGQYMVSGDKDGIIIIWDAITHDCKQVIAAHAAPVLCCSISPSGRHVISSGADEHICVINVESGVELFNLDDALDGQALTVKFSFDGSHVQLGGEKGNILIWDVERNCLLYDIQAHTGRVYDCSWSGDSRRLLSVGTDGRARLWDAAAGSEMCHANFDRGVGAIESGGFVKCDLSSDGNLMAGCTTKGHLFAWDVGQELRREPNGQMLYQWLASMPVSMAKAVYTELLDNFPLLYNAQDSRGWTVLMHAAANSNPEIVKVIVTSVRHGCGSLGLMASPLQRLADGGPPSVAMANKMASMRAKSFGAVQHATASTSGRSKRLSPGKVAPAPPNGRSFGGAGAFAAAASGGVGAAGVAGPGGTPSTADAAMPEPNAIRIAISASSGDCVHHLLNAVLDQKVTPGSYHCVTRALADVAEQYPTMCEAFLTGLPLRTLGEMEVPARIAALGMVVHAATSYTSYKELWEMKLKLDAMEKGPMVVMEAVMVQLPFPAEVGSEGLLHKLGESNLPVKAFGSDTVQAIITFKWKKFSQRAIFIKTIIYLAYLFIFTAYACLLGDDLGPLQTVPVDPDNADGPTMVVGVDFHGLASYPKGVAEIVLSIIVFMFGAYFMALEGMQLYKLGPSDYFSSFWNFMDLSAYACSMIIPPCVLTRYQMSDAGFVYALVACESLLLWGKSLFYGLAIDGLGTFIYMIIQIIKGLKYFYVLLGMLYISFGVALANLFRTPPSGTTGFALFPGYESFKNALLSLYLSQMENQDARAAYGTMWSDLAIIVLCLYTFLANVIMLNLIITLMGDLYAKIKEEQQLVFLRNRADLILEVESTMPAKDVARFRTIPPYLHLLRPVNLEGKREEDKKDDGIAGGGSGGAAGADADVDDAASGVVPPMPRRSVPGAGRVSMSGFGGPGEGNPGRELSHFANASIVSRAGGGGMMGVGGRSIRASRAGSFGLSGATEVHNMHRVSGPGGGALNRSRSCALQAIRADALGQGAAGGANLERLLGEMQSSLDRQNRELVGLRRTVEVLARGGTAAHIDSQPSPAQPRDDGAGDDSWAAARAQTSASAATVPRRDAKLPGSPRRRVSNDGGSGHMTVSAALAAAAAAGTRPMTTPVAGTPKSGPLDAEPAVAADAEPAEAQAHTAGDESTSKPNINASKHNVVFADHGSS